MTCVFPAPRLVGRAAELDELTRIADAVRDGSGGQLVLLPGEAGIGKATTIRAFCATREATVLTGQCLMFGAETTPLAAISHALRDLVTRFGPDRVAQWAGAGADALATIVPARWAEVPRKSGGCSNSRPSPRYWRVRPASTR